MKQRFTEEQIITILREQEAGFPVKDIWRRHGIAEQTFYRWKSKYGGMEVSEAKRLRALELENAKLKKLLAETMLDNVALKAERGSAIGSSAARRFRESGRASRTAERGFAPGVGA